MDGRAYIALGSNLGNSIDLVRAAMDRLQSLSSAPIQRSSLWRSSPVDCPPGSPDFINAAVAIVPLAPTPEELHKATYQLEGEFGRRPKTIHNEARPMDLDIIAWGSHVRAADLILPHPRAHLRKFVLAPLAEIAPNLILPGQSAPVAALLANLHTNELIQRLV